MAANSNTRLERRLAAPARSRVRPGLRGAVVLVTATLVGCTGARAGSPRSTLESVRNAAQRADADALYALLPASARRATTLEAFRARMATERAELHTLGEALANTLPSRSPVVELATTDGVGATAVDDIDGWRVARAGFGPGTTPTPTDALRALRAALRRRSLPALLQVLSARARGALLADFAAISDALEDPSAVGSLVTHTGQGPGSTERREVLLPDGRRLMLLREGPSWRIDDLQER